ncbi:MAG TPA: Uma2 family endonuclease [Thermoanaerobaculia bacterium]|nr:Uma2 family endonuclease [Thermoanaerobaculia bacterium]
MAEPLKKLFTVSEYHSMVETGILSEDSRFELIEGEIYRMAPIGSRHAGCVNHLNYLLKGAEAILAPQNPAYMNEHSEPQPDIALLRWRDDFYASSHPSPEDILLLIEVADTSIEFDRRKKIPLYASSGVPDFWLVDLIKSTIEIYREPTTSGFRDIRKLRKGDRISPLAFPDLELNVSDILG